MTVELIDDNLVVLDKMHGQIHQLNATASLVWTAIAEGKSLYTIASELADRFEVTKEKVTSDVESVVGQFEALNLLESRELPESNSFENSQGI